MAGEPWALPRQPQAAFALAYLVTLGSVGLFVLLLLVVRRWTVSATSYMFVLFPVVTLALGALLADEPVTAQAIIGAALVTGRVVRRAVPRRPSRCAAAGRGLRAGGRPRSVAIAAWPGCLANGQLRRERGVKQQPGTAQ